MTLQSLPYVTFLGFLYGSTLIATRFGLGQFEPLTYSGLRLVAASLGYAAIYQLVRRRHWPKDRRLWRHAGVYGSIGTAIPATTLVASLQHLSSGVTSVLITTYPAITVLLAHFFLPEEALTRRKGLGVSLALAGAAFLAIRGESGLPDVTQANPLGYILVLLALVSSSSTIIYARRYMHDLDAFDVASARMFVAALIVMPLSLLLSGLDLHAVNSQGYLALGYAALCGTFGGALLSFYNIKRFGATAAAMTAYFVPLFATIGGVLFLGERFTPVMLVGMGLIVLGIAILNQGHSDQAAQTS